MEFSKVYTAPGVYNRQEVAKGPQNIFVDVVLLEKSSTQTLYQLNAEAVQKPIDYQTIKTNFLTMRHDAFIKMGTVQTVKRKSKMVVLDDGNTVTYNYLIVVSSPHHFIADSLNDHECSAALQTLIDALRTRKPASSALAKTEKNCADPKKTVTYSSQQPQATHDIEKLAQPSLQTSAHPSQGNLSSFNKLYEVQV